MASRDDLVGFHTEHLRHLLAFLSERGIRSHRQLADLRATKLLEESMWKLLEVDGKYAGEFVSEGVQRLSELTGRPPSSQGKWSESTLIAALGPAPQHGWQSSPRARCRLDHVIDRRILNEWLLEDPSRLDELLNKGLIGCVVLDEEHRRLERNDSARITDPWHKYRLAGVRVWSRTRREWVV